MLPHFRSTAFLLFSICILGFLSCTPGSRNTDAPNFIIIMADDLGYGDLSCYGNSSFATPNIDSLAANGLRFINFYANASVCSPTRAALLTGRYQQRSGMEAVLKNTGPTRDRGLALDEVLFSEALKEAGYATGIMGKWHLGYDKQFNPVNQGFDEFWGFVGGNIDYQSKYDGTGTYDWWHNGKTVKEDGYVTDLITKHAVDFIEDHKNEAFCLYVSHQAPHFPYQGPNDKADRLPGQEWDHLGSRQDKQAAYKEMIVALDNSVGSILNTIKELELTEETLIIFTSDNGAVENMGNNSDFKGSKGKLWEGGFKVPAIAWWPGKIEPSISFSPCISMDLFPTMLHLAGIDSFAGPELDGENISEVLFSGITSLFDPKAKTQLLTNRYLFFKRNDNKAARYNKYKAAIDRDGNEYLFDLAADPRESINLRDSLPEMFDYINEKMVLWEADVYEGVEMVSGKDAE